MVDLSIVSRSVPRCRSIVAPGHVLDHVVMARAPARIIEAKRC